MELKLFGKSLFEVKKSVVNNIYNAGISVAQESKFLPDFYKGFERNDSFIVMSQAIEMGAIKNVEPEKKPAVEKKTPKEIHEMRLLHNEVFKLNTDPAYIDSQLSDFKDKLALIKSEEYDMARGVKEIGSIVIRLENRKKYPEVKDFFENFPYTNTAKIEDLIKAHDYLKIGQMAQFLADMPKEATKIMKEYNVNTGKVCNKQAIFYIIADKKDFEKTRTRRDPILLAQSPFGHFWQILGAWSDELLIIDEL